MNRRVLLAAAALATVLASCAANRPWTVTVENSSGSPVRVRIATDAGTSDWIIRPLATEVIVNGGMPISGDASVVDDQTCAIVATTHFVESSGLLVLVDRGPDDDGGWQLSTIPETADAAALPPVVDACSS